jgi:hypothetical protein
LVTQLGFIFAVFGNLIWICRFTNLIRKKMMLLFVLNVKPKLDLQIGLPNHFARPRFGKTVCQIDLAFRFGKPCGS